MFRKFVDNLDKFIDEKAILTLNNDEILKRNFVVLDNEYPLFRDIHSLDDAI